MLPTDFREVNAQHPAPAAVCMLVVVFLHAVYNNAFKANPALLSPSAYHDPKTSAYLAPQASGRDSFKLPKTSVDRRYVLQSTQPLIEVNGMLRWAFDNVAHASGPPCKPVLDTVYSNPTWAADHAAEGPNSLNTDSYWGKIGGDTSDLYVNKSAQIEVGSVGCYVACCSLKC